MTTLLYTHPSAARHETPPGHPERAERSLAVERELSGEAYRDLIRREAPLGRDEDILRAHAPEHLARIKSASPAEGWSRLDPDTYMSPATLEVALRGVGGAVAAVDGVFAGEANSAFVAMRPPGHHAERRRPMGFCFFNNVAIAAHHARARHGAERVAVVDFDVHHGNGTQDIFWSDAALFYGSTHQFPFYPGTGAPAEKGVGNIFNAPLQAGEGSREFRQAMERIILPALDRFAPDLLIISAGFDAHHNDPLGGLALAEADFGWVTLKLLEQADKHCAGRVVSVLEGGYDLAALASCTGIHVQALMRGTAESVKEGR